MGEASSIAWTDATFNPWWGCVKVSPGCTHCYAETFSKRTGHNVWGVNAPRRFFGDKHWAEPLKWGGKKVFCGSMCDWLEDAPGLDEQRARLFALIDATPNVTWQLLSKRIERYNQCVPEAWLKNGAPKNVWIGTTVEDKQRAYSRIPILAGIQALVRFVSAEPLLEDIGDVLAMSPVIAGQIDWYIVGGESGAGARPFNPNWARSVQDFCNSTKETALGSAYRQSAFFMKQLGGVRDKRDKLEDLPEDLRVRDFPRGKFSRYMRVTFAETLDK